MTVELRRAAALMRERVEALSLPPFGDAVEDWTSEWLVSAGFDGADADHIASWHPDVALAVAKSLDTLAEAVEDDYFDLGDFVVRDALAVARAYLGECS
jgi:hypothetical protein